MADLNLIKKEGERPPWTFLTNHGHVLICICSDPGIRGRDIAAQVGITERAAQAIIADLVDSGYIRRTRVGRRNHYLINPEQPFRHPLEQAHRIGELLQLLTDSQANSMESHAIEMSHSGSTG